MCIPVSRDAELILNLKGNVVAANCEGSLDMILAGG
jgi:hypothetical protein